MTEFMTSQKLPEIRTSSELAGNIGKIMAVENDNEITVGQLVGCVEDSYTLGPTITIFKTTAPKVAILTANSDRKLNFIHPTRGMNRLFLASPSFLNEVREFLISNGYKTSDRDISNWIEGNLS